MSFWDIVWFIFITWVFVAYLMVMFSIIADIFRDREMSGVVKALWCVALVFLPFITALVYVIARGHSMTERSMRAATEQSTQARALLDSGAITQPEYEALKAKALGAAVPPQPRAPSAEVRADSSR